jgi:hypothetical protein
MVGMGLITYRFGFGMNQNQRSVMALGMGTRNVAAVLAAALAIPNADPRILTMTIMWTLWSVVLAAIGAKYSPNRPVYPGPYWQASSPVWGSRCLPTRSEESWGLLTR